MTATAPSATTDPVASREPLTDLRLALDHARACRVAVAGDHDSIGAMLLTGRPGSATRRGSGL